MAATTARLLADLPHEPRHSPVPECDAGTPVVAARLALAPASDNLRPLRPVRLRALTQPSGTLRPQRTTWPPARTCCRPAAIMTHASEIILRAPTVGASQLSLEPAFAAGPHDAAAAMGGTRTSWRAVTGTS